MFPQFKLLETEVRSLCDLSLIPVSCPIMCKHQLSVLVVGAKSDGQVSYIVGAKFIYILLSVLNFPCKHTSYLEIAHPTTLWILFQLPLQITFIIHQAIEDSIPHTPVLSYTLYNLHCVCTNSYLGFGHFHVLCTL